MENKSVSIADARQESPSEVSRAATARRGRRAGLAGVVLAVVLACSGSAHAETRVYFVRGWFGVFSTGMDAMAEQLQSKGIKAEAIGHLEWRSTVSKIVDERTADGSGRIVLVGHSQGANNVINMARELGKHNIPVDLLITLAPFLQDPVPSNVVRAINYFQSPGWGSPLTADPGFKGELSNINMKSDSGILHINIDKDAKVQAQVVGAIAALLQ
jgi:hypothetical protein